MITLPIGLVLQIVELLNSIAIRKSESEIFTVAKQISMDLLIEVKNQSK